MPEKLSADKRSALRAMGAMAELGAPLSEDEAAGIEAALGKR